MPSSSSSGHRIVDHRGAAGQRLHKIYQSIIQVCRLQLRSTLVGLNFLWGVLAMSLPSVASWGKGCQAVRYQFERVKSQVRPHISLHLPVCSPCSSSSSSYCSVLYVDILRRQTSSLCLPLFTWDADSAYGCYRGGWC